MEDVWFGFIITLINKHMTCRKCRHEFCWLCFGNWRGHSSCNKTEEVISQERKAEESKNDLEKYMFFWHRYDSHFKAMVLKSK